MFAIRLQRQPLVDVREHLEVAPVREIRVVPRLDEREAQLREASPGGTEERRLLELFERISGPQRERSLEQRGRRRRVVVGQRGAPVAEERLRTMQIDFLQVDVEAVAGTLGDDMVAVLTHFGSQPGHRDLQGRFGMVGQACRPRGIRGSPTG